MVPRLSGLLRFVLLSLFLYRCTVRPDASDDGTPVAVLQVGLHVEIITCHGSSGGKTMTVQLVSHVKLAWHGDVYA